MKQAVRYIYWILITIYLISIVIFFFKKDISNYIMNHDPNIIDFRSLTYEEHKNSIKAQELAPKIYIVVYVLFFCNDFNYIYSTLL